MYVQKMLGSCSDPISAKKSCMRYYCTPHCNSVRIMGIVYIFCFFVACNYLPQPIFIELDLSLWWVQVAVGGFGGILYPTLDEKLNTLYEAIAVLAAEPKSEESEEEHVLENFHSNRTIRKLILDCPTFAATLWTKALKGKCSSWAQGHRLVWLLPTT